MAQAYQRTHSSLTPLSAFGRFPCPCRGIMQSQELTAATLKRPKANDPLGWGSCVGSYSHHTASYTQMYTLTIKAPPLPPWPIPSPSGLQVPLPHRNVRWRAQRSSCYALCSCRTAPFPRCRPLSHRACHNSPAATS